MNEQQLRDIAKAAFKRQFGDIEIVGINIRQRLDHDDDPVVDVDIFYDDDCGQVNARGHSLVRSEILAKTWYEGKEELGYPLVHLRVKAGLQRNNPAAA